MSFDVFSFHPRIQSGIKTAGYTTPTPIQSQTIQPVLDGRDVMGLAQTGTGKTAAFVLPILQRILTGQRARLRALILSPTRELAEQTHTVIKALGQEIGIRSVTLYGGVSAAPQVAGVRAGAEIAVACPGRLLDLMGQGVVKLERIEALVVDEADMMFDMGFLPSIRRILSALPKQRQTLLFSATMPEEIRALAVDMLTRPVTVEIGASRPVETVEQTVYAVEQDGKYELLRTLLNGVGGGQVLVFTRTKHRAKRLAMQLINAGMPATSLQGNLSQNQRQLAMDRFRSGRAQVMVATDIAARGIDVTQVTHVINYDVPDTAEAYTHRIGRTGRMERLGTAFTLATQEDLPMIRAIERLLGKPLQRVRPANLPQAGAGLADPVGQDRPAPESAAAPRDANSRPAANPANRSGERTQAREARPLPERTRQQTPGNGRVSSHSHDNQTRSGSRPAGQAMSWRTLPTIGRTLLEDEEYHPVNAQPQPTPAATPESGAAPHAPSANQPGYNTRRQPSTGGRTPERETRSGEAGKEERWRNSSRRQNGSAKRER